MYECCSHSLIPECWTGRFSKLWDTIVALQSHREIQLLKLINWLIGNRSTCFIFDNFFTVKYHLTSSQHLPSHGSQNTSNSQNCQPSESSSGEQHWLSADDRECLWQLGDHVEALGGHLRCHCDRLTLRTKLYLAQIECLREMAV